MSRGFDPSWRSFVPKMPASALPARSKYRAQPHIVLPDLVVLP